MKKHKIAFLVTDDQKDELETLAPGSVADYVRKAVFKQVKVDAALHSLEDRQTGVERQLHRVEATLHKMASNKTSDGEAIPPELAGALIETLVLLRSLTSPAKLDAAKADVKRAGLPVWSL